MKKNTKSVVKHLLLALRAAGFDREAIANRLGPAAEAAMRRGEPAPVLRATREGTRLDALIRGVILHEPADGGEILGSDLAEALRYAGLLRDGVLVVDVRHLGQELIASDADATFLTHVPGRDHVLGVGSASLSLICATPTTPVDTLLDLGTGSGVQLLAAKDWARHSVGTDIHQPALDYAAANLEVAGIDAELLQGSWFAPVAGRTFDRVVANPPFVVGPATTAHIYRDSGLALDEASELVVREVPRYLNPGGSAHILASWVDTPEQRWQDRVAAWVLQRDQVSPEQYVATWLADESLDVRSAEATRRAEEWLEFFARAGVTSVGFGVIALQSIEGPSEVVAEELLQPFTDPLGPETQEYFARASWLRRQTPDSIDATRFAVRPGAALHRVSLPDQENGFGFAPEVTRITRTDGPRWSHEIDEALASILAGLNPHGLNLAETAGLFAAARGVDESALLPQARGAIVDLVRHGIVIPEELIA